MGAGDNEGVPGRGPEIRTGYEGQVQAEETQEESYPRQASEQDIKRAARSCRIGRETRGDSVATSWGYDRLSFRRKDFDPELRRHGVMMGSPPEMDALQQKARETIM